MEGTSFILLRFQPYFTSPRFHMFFSNRQPYTGTFILISVVQSLKDNKNFIEKLGVDANTVILNANLPMCICFECRYVYGRGLVFFRVLKGIIEQRMHCLHQGRPETLHYR